MFTQTFHLKNKGGERERDRKKGNTTSTDSLWGQRGLCCPNSGWCFLSTLLSTTLSKGLRLWTRHGRVSLSPLQTNGSLGSSGLHSEVWANCVKLGRRWELPVRNTFRVKACCRERPPPSTACRRSPFWSEDGNLFRHVTQPRVFCFKNYLLVFGTFEIF